MIDTSPATPSTHAPTVTPLVQPTTQAKLTPAEASKMAEWAKADLLAGNITQAQADKQFAELNTPLEQRGPDTRTDEQKMLDTQFPTAKESDYVIRYGEPGQELKMTPELQQFDQSARTWMSSAGLPRELGNSLVNAIAKVAQHTQHMTTDQLETYRQTELAKLQRAHAEKLPQRLHLADDMINLLEQERPGLKQLLGSKGIGKSAMVWNVL